MSYIAGCAPGPYTSLKHLRKELGWSIPQGIGKGGSICIAQAHPRSMEEEGWEAAGCAGEGLGSSWDLGAGNTVGAAIA